MPTYEVRTIPWLQRFEPADDVEDRVPVGEVVSTHANYAEAVAACDALHAERWADRDFNPFRHGGETLFFQTTLPPGPFRDYLQDRGLELPQSRAEVSNAGWVRWYKSKRAKLTEPQLATLREALNLVRFAEVVELPDGATKVSVVQELNWSWDHETTLDADGEGGNLVAAYRGRAKAEARCAALGAARRVSPEFRHWPSFNNLFRRSATGECFTGIDETTFYEVVEIDGVGLGSKAGKSVAVVYRQAVNDYGCVIGPNEDHNDADGELSGFVSVVPVRAFADRAAADAHAAELLRAVRRTVNPFLAMVSPRAALVRGLKIKFNVQPLHKGTGSSGSAGTKPKPRT